MRWVRQSTIGVVLALSLSMPVAAQDKQEKRPPVRAKEPTVVTVHGSAEEVRPDKSSRESDRDGTLERGVRAVGNGTVWVGKRIGGWLDFNWDGDQVVPSERERQKKQDKSTGK